MIKWEIRVLLIHYLQQGVSKSKIARKLGLNRRTINRWIADGELERDLDTGELPTWVRRGRPKKLEDFKPIIDARLEKYPDLSAVRLFEETKAAGYAGGLTQLKLHVAQVRPHPAPEPIVRFETEPGHPAQVDFAEFKFPWGKRYALVVVLGYSRLLWLKFYSKQDMQTVFSGLEEAFAFFGGVPREILPDNPKTVVLVRGATVRESTLHPHFLDFLGHYALELQLCEPRRPRTKGKVERPMRYIATSLVLPSFEHWHSPEDANREARIWLDSVANVRVHGTTRERPCDRLLREQLRALHSVRPYDLTWSEPRRVQKDCHFSWEGNFYSVPWQHGSSAVLVRRSPEGRLEVERAGELIATHRERVGGRGEHITLPAHLAGLWQKTLGRKQAHAPPADTAALASSAEKGQTGPLSLLHAGTALQSTVEQRDLAVYQELLEAAPSTEAVPAAEAEVAA
jgi:transposase